MESVAPLNVAGWRPYVRVYSESGRCRAQAGVRPDEQPRRRERANQYRPTASDATRRRLPFPPSLLGEAILRALAARVSLLETDQVALRIDEIGEPAAIRRSRSLQETNAFALENVDQLIETVCAQHEEI